LLEKQPKNSPPNKPLKRQNRRKPRRSPVRLKSNAKPMNNAKQRNFVHKRNVMQQRKLLLLPQNRRLPLLCLLPTLLPPAKNKNFLNSSAVIVRTRSRHVSITTNAPAFLPAATFLPPRFN